MFKPYELCRNVAETSLHYYNTGPTGYISLTSTLKDVAAAALEPGHVLEPQ